MFSSFISLLFFILYILFFVMLIAWLRSSFVKGMMGEMLVNLNNKLRLDSVIYQNMRDVTLRLKDGSTTQIDHIILSPYGLFVIETKNMKGWIFGSEHEKYWIQNLYGKKYTFQNPLLQNYRHLKALEEVLNLKEGLFSIVTFVGKSEFKREMPKNIFHGGAYIKYIKSFRRRIFSEEIVMCMVDILNDERLENSRATKKEHISSLSKRDKYSYSSEILCSKCSSVMIQRRNKKTQELFLGCSTYPKCKHTKVV